MPQHNMVARSRSVDRVVNVRDELTRAMQRAERGLAAVSAQGFREVSRRVRQAVLDSERLVVVLDRLVVQGFRRRGRKEPVTAAAVEPAIQAVRAAVGAFAVTTAPRFSADYQRYAQAVERLVEVARSVLDRGVESPVNAVELDEWKMFRD